MLLTQAAKDAEREAIDRALATSNGNVAAAARLLRLPLRTMWRRLAVYHINNGDHRLKRQTKK